MSLKNVPGIEFVDHVAIAPGAPEQPLDRELPSGTPQCAIMG